MSETGADHAARKGAAIRGAGSGRPVRILNAISAVMTGQRFRQGGYALELHHQNSQTVTHAASVLSGTAIAETYGGPMGYARLAASRR